MGTINFNAFGGGPRGFGGFGKGFEKFRDMVNNGGGEKTVELRPFSIRARVILWILFVIWLCGSYYVMLPPMNIHSTETWNYLAFCVILPATLIIGIQNISDTLRRGLGRKGLNKPVKIGIIIFIVLLAGSFLVKIYGLEIFHAREYASILQPKDYVFTEDIDQSTAVSKIALMDTSSAIKFGNREMGTLSELVSQYNVSENYAQIDYNGAPLKVSALDYAGFFKYWANKDHGVPGYVSVDPVGQDAKYNPLPSGMKYVPSGYFNDRLDRHLRFQFPFKIFGNIHFEIDEEGKPYYIASVYGYKIGLFDGQTVIGAIVCDPVSGDSTYYDLADVPQWVDDVFPGELLVTQYNWNGLLSNGFLNSKFAKQGVRRATQTKNDGGDVQADYGYIAKDGDIWIYTGVTSVNEDASNVGFILVNQRTGDAHYYTIPGADENSAMSAAEGEVQEKRYQASFPSLINVDEQPTYVMVLKDASGIVKLYAMVNVQSYNIVTTASNLDDCFAQYRRLIKGGEATPASPASPAQPQPEPTPVDEGPELDAEFTISSIQYVDINGDTYVYLEGNDGKIYRQKFADNEALITFRNGDNVKVKCTKKNDTTFNVKKIEKKAE
ncbi:MAG: hypothetical protein IK152_08305 [Lachnospiraceae bacterium]|nr:hypothetical protein [Lachnospiraceae bacterium]